MRGLGSFEEKEVGELSRGKGQGALGCRPALTPGTVRSSLLPLRFPHTHTNPLSRGDTLRGSCHMRFWWHLAPTLPPPGDLQSADPTAFLPPGNPMASPFSCQPGLIIPLISKHSAPFMGNIAGNKLPRASLRGCSGGREPPGQDLHRAAR